MSSEEDIVKQHFDSLNSESPVFKQIVAVLKMCDLSNWNQPFAGTFTMKQGQKIYNPNGRPVSVKLDYDKVIQNFRHFLNVINKKVYGNATKKLGRKLRVIPVIEYSPSMRSHIHFCIDKPIELDKMDQLEYSNLIRNCWGKTQWSYKEMDIQPNANSGWIIYILKPFDKITYDLSIDFMNFHNP